MFVSYVIRLTQHFKFSENRPVYISVQDSRLVFFLANHDPNLSKSLERHSSVVLETDLEIENDRPVQSSTPFASRPVNPTPAQAAGRPTRTSVRPTNPTPRQASNVIDCGENCSDSPRINNVHSVSDYTPLEALLETRNELSFEELEERRVDNDTALDFILISSGNTHLLGTLFI